MKKILILSDSFKGTLSSGEICEIAKERIKSHMPDCEVIAIPVADGGEGSVDCFLQAMDGSRIDAACKGPYFEEIQAFFGVVNDRRTAVIEVAACCGLPLVEGRKNPLLTTTYGVGELIDTALSLGCEEILIGLGGTCTNDGGCGMASALGVRFYNEAGEAFIPTGGTLCDIAKIDKSEMRRLPEGVTITAMCDVENPLYGKEGAAHIFARQKGADDSMIEHLDKGLVHLARLIERDLGIDAASISGGGAAGGLGAGMKAFLGAELKRGIEAVLDTVNFEKLAEGADLAITGEGKLDSQSLRGKVISGVAARAKRMNIPVMALVGGIGDDADEIYDCGLDAVFSINRLPEDFAVSRSKSRENYAFALDNLIRLIKTIEK